VSSAQILKELENLLVQFIPQAVQSRDVAEPVYCLRIWFYGTDSIGDLHPSLVLKKESARRRVIAEKGVEAPYYLWCADELTTDRDELGVPLKVKRISELCVRFYEQLRGGQSDEEQLQPMREAIQRVAARLNVLDWRDLTKATDDFVVIPADGAHIFNGFEDMTASVSAQRIADFQKRGLLGDVDWWRIGSDEMQ
jgi:hypothetical protein